LLNYVVLRALR